MDDRFVDLHTHTVASDGSMTPAELIRHATERGLACVAVTDHDSVEGLDEAESTAKETGIELIPAIEFSVQSDTETHILGYGIDRRNPTLQRILREVRECRTERTETTARNLRSLGFDITVEEVEPLAPSGLIGRAHFASLMVQKGYVSSVREAFDKYLASGRPAFCNTQRLNAAEAVDLIHEAGGGAFVAHLHLIRMEDEPLFAFLRRLKEENGLDGIEGYYTDYTPDMQDKYQGMAKKLDLMLSGGTDFHAKMKPHIQIGTGLGNLRIPYAVAEAIMGRFCR